MRWEYRTTKVRLENGVINDSKQLQAVADDSREEGPNWEIFAATQLASGETRLFMKRPVTGLWLRSARQCKAGRVVATHRMAVQGEEGRPTGRHRGSSPRTAAHGMAVPGGAW